MIINKSNFVALFYVFPSRLVCFLVLLAFFFTDALEICECRSCLAVSLIRDCQLKQA